MPERRRVPVRGIVIAALTVALAGLIVLLGALHPPRRAGVFTDRLGPEQGAQVADYCAQARDSLAGSDEQDHWALVSFTDYRTSQQIPTHSGGLRITQVIYRVPAARVQTPVVTVPVPAGDAVAVASAAAAAAMLLARPSDEARSARIAAFSAARLRADCACVVGLVVLGPLSRLRELAATNGIRAVQALPADAVAGHFAVVPLLPDHIDVVAPGPDDGTVPDS